MLQGGICHLLHLLFILKIVDGSSNLTATTFDDTNIQQQNNMILEEENLEKILKEFPDVFDQINLNENIVNPSATNATPSDILNSNTNQHNLSLITSSIASTVPGLTPPSSSSSSLSLSSSSVSLQSTVPVLSTKSTNSHIKNLKIENQKTLVMKPTTSNVNGTSSTGTLKVGKTNAPMLNYIYDAHSNLNKHYHHDHRYGPHFEDSNNSGNSTNVTVQAGNTAFLNCRISLLQDKTVSWVRRKHEGEKLQLLTVGMHTYSGDSRYSVELQYPNNWRLKISYANKRDEGLYECQISTHPPKVIQIYLKVNAPEVTIVDEQGFPLMDKYYEVDSTIQLTCKVRFISMTSSVVYWLHGNRTLNYDVTRGGISVKTDLMENGANSVLFIAKVNKSDSGNYSCSIGGKTQFTTTVHVLNGESLAELYHGGTDKITQNNNIISLLSFLIILNFILFNSMSSTIR